jgi:hypothetical protein
MNKYKLKEPEIIEAIQVKFIIDENGDEDINIEEISEFLGNDSPKYAGNFDISFKLLNDWDLSYAPIDDYLIKNKSGEIKVINEKDFINNFELVSTDL